MIQQQQPLVVTAYLWEGAQALQQACAGIDGLTLRFVHDDDALVAATTHSEVLILSDACYSAALAGALQAPDSRVRWLQFSSAGFNRALAHGVPVDVIMTNASPAFASTVAEHAMALLLALVRMIPASDRQRDEPTWRRDILLARLDSLEGQTLAVVGYGAIGRAVAQRAKGFGMRVEVVGRTPPAPGGDVDASHPLSQLHAVLARADAVVLAVALNDSTHHLIDRSALRYMQAHARLVNVARGAVVDEQALIAALNEGVIAAAGLDVFAQEPLPGDSPLRQMSNVVMTPHIGGFGGARVHARLAALLSDNLRRYLHGDELLHQARQRQPGSMASPA